MAVRPLCFVLMPFREKDDPTRPGKPINFDVLYEKAIKPAILDAGLDSIRADEEKTLGIIHKPMFERLLLCDFAVADLTVPNANVFYELGVRHASRNNTTLPIFAKHTSPPFDVAMLRALPYRLGEQNEIGDSEVDELRASLSARLKDLRELVRRTSATDSPFFQLIEKSQQSNLPADARLRRVRETDAALYELLNRYSHHDKTDVFRDLVDYNIAKKRELAIARDAPKAEALEMLDRVRKQLEPDEVEAGVLVDLYLSYRAIGAPAEMLSLHDQMPRSLQRSVLVREQRAFALNRLAEAHPRDDSLRDEAIRILQEVLGEIGPSSETYGLLGRVHKDRWQEAHVAGRKSEARGHLHSAVTSYVMGFEADWRDAYPGVNAVTLLDVQGTEASLHKKQQLLPVVRFAVERRLARGNADYWDLASLLELEVLEDNPERAREYRDRAIALVRERWEPKTTAKNLTYIRDARKKRGNEVDWLIEIIQDLHDKAEKMVK